MKDLFRLERETCGENFCGRFYAFDPAFDAGRIFLRMIRTMLLRIIRMDGTTSLATHKKGLGAMYVCLCNAVTDRQIKGCTIEAGQSVGKLCKSLGVTPKCGKCIGMMRQMLSEANMSNQSSS